jgi:hypothetical protein
MIRRAWLLSVSLAVAAAGCNPLESTGLWPDSSMGTVPDRPFTAAPTGPMPTIANAPPGTLAATQRVNAVGQRLMEANAELPVRPLFLGVGSPDPQIFHNETRAIYVSDGLVSKCTTDAQLAAVLANELGRMVSAREAQLALKARRGERDTPVGLAVGTESGGTFGPADGTRLAELGKFEKDTGHGPAGGSPSLPPNPELLARTYLKKAGFAATDLDAVGPLLHEAAQHNDIEKQLSGGALRTFVGP